jgi:hypothetical protein
MQLEVLKGLCWYLRAHILFLLIIVVFSQLELDICLSARCLSRTYPTGWVYGFEIGVVVLTLDVLDTGPHRLESGGVAITLNT